MPASESPGVFLETETPGFYPRPAESGTLEMGPRNLCSNKCMLRFEKQSLFSFPLSICLLKSYACTLDES